jgi:Leucine-rich repeat (LRR) protein
MGGLVAKFSCKAILCPGGTYNELGRQTSVASVCKPCPDNIYYGAKVCGARQIKTTVSILKQIFSSMNGNNWKENAGWTSSSDYCSWFGVGCNAIGDVVKLNLENNGLTGTVPKLIFQFSSVRELNLQGNRISFSFDGIEQASRLSTLILSFTGLESVDGIGKAKELTELHLTDNNLHGTFPTELLTLTGLQTLLLNFNQIEGRIPDSISALSNLEELYLFHNRLGGQLPAALGSLTKLRTLGLSENNFSGYLPVQFNELVNLEVLTIQRGGSDSITLANVGVDQGPSEDEGKGISGQLLTFDRMTKLRQLYLGTNSLIGSIPHNFLDGIVDKSETIEVDLLSNRLSGEVPASLARFERLTLYIADNKISAIPSGICNQGGWMDGQVALFSCDALLCPPGTSSMYGRQADTSSGCASCGESGEARYYGSFSCLDSDAQEMLDEWSVLEEFYLATDGDNWRNSDNWMNPDISFCDWHGVACTADGRVKSIHLMQNALDGKIPPSIFGLSHLEEINFSSNDVRISFEGIPRATSLQYVSLDSTMIQSLAGLELAPSLTLLHIVGNDFGGTFPP